MLDETIDFGSLLCARLCHDLAGPIGGLNLAVGLLDDRDATEMQRDALAAVTDGVEALVAELRFLRLAFGAGGPGTRVAADEVRASLEGRLRGGAAPVLAWMVDEAELDQDAARLLMLLFQIALAALPRGGRLDVGVERGEIAVRAEGPRLAFDPLVAAHLRGDAAEPPRSRDAAAVLAAALAARRGRELMVAHGDGVLVLGASAGRD